MKIVIDYSMDSNNNAKQVVQKMNEDGTFTELTEGESLRVLTFGVVVHATYQRGQIILDLDVYKE